MKEIQFDVDLTVSELYAFSIRHTYCSISGVVGLLISIGSLVICALRYKVLDRTTVLALIIIGLLFTVVQPVMLYSKAHTQRRRNKDINALLHYCLSEEGIHVSQGEQEVMVPWYEVRKMVQTGKAVYLYMSPVRAFIFPQSQCGDQFAEMVDLIRAMLERYKDYDPAEEVSGETEEHDVTDAPVSCQQCKGDAGHEE